MVKYSVFGLNFYATDYDEATDLIIEKAIQRKSFCVAALNAHGLVESYRFQKFRNIANRFDLVLPDGYSIIWALNRIYKLNLRNRVTGPDLTIHLLKRADLNKLRVFLFGSYEDNAQKFSAFITENFPNVTICGIQSDRFRDSTNEEDLMDIQKINNSGANILFVGRGCPRQEYWIYSHKNKIHAAMIGIGGAFDIYSRKVRRAPMWMRNSGLEWVYRLYQEPKRLWKRYLISNFGFAFLFVRHQIQRVYQKKEVPN